MTWTDPGRQAAPTAPPTTPPPAPAAATGTDFLTGPAFDPTSQPTPQPTRAPRSRLLLPAIAAIAAIAVGGVGYAATRPPAKETITGTFTLIDSDYKYNSIGGSTSSCYGEDGYSDIGPGTQVVVRNGDGKLLASSRFGEGTGKSTAGTLYGCIFPFSLEVPPGEDFYAITVGSSSGDGRGEMSYSAEDLEEKDWEVGLTLGD